jgi:hypothetical protein
VVAGVVEVESFEDATTKGAGGVGGLNGLVGVAAVCGREAGASFEAVVVLLAVCVRLPRGVREIVPLGSAAVDVKVSTIRAGADESIGVAVSTTFVTGATMGATAVAAAGTAGATCVTTSFAAWTTGVAAVPRGTVDATLTTVFWTGATAFCTGTAACWT